MVCFGFLFFSYIRSLLVVFEFALNRISEVLSRIFVDALFVLGECRIGFLTVIGCLCFLFRLCGRESAVQKPRWLKL